jgi:hypothetical protein
VLAVPVVRLHAEPHPERGHQSPGENAMLGKRMKFKEIGDQLFEKALAKNNETYL